ncbi:MAG: rhodanese-like domain-containing protein [Burkholderiaceae bacterium]|nr:rhodanese-like domain-containing protein [Burkholderiaceae bacterium]
MTAEITQVHPSQLADWLSAQTGLSAPAVLPVVLDVREPWELERASIKPPAQCSFMALPMALIPLRLSELDPQRPIAVLCHHGARSMQVAHFLVRNGFSTVANITGGIAVWASEFDATVPQY